MTTLEAVRRWQALARAVRGNDGADLRTRARRSLDALGIRLDTDAERLSVPTDSGTLIVANHLSWVDIVALLALEPAAFLAKHEVARWPGVGRIADRLGTVFLHRSSLRGLPGSVAAVTGTLRAGRSVVVFPEGTTWCRPPGGPFRRAVFQSALDAGAPVRPVTLELSQAGRPSTLAAFVGDDSLVASMARVSTGRDVAIRLRAHPALDPVGDRRLLAAQAHRAVLAGLSTSEQAHV